MNRTQQRAMAHQVARDLLPLMGLTPELVEGPDVLCVFDELYHTQPQSMVYRWWERADERQIDLFVDEWEAWRAQELARCAFCRGRKEHVENVLCAACSDLLEGPGSSLGSKREMFEPVNSQAHDDRCLCPGCSGLCQDDYEFYAGTGPYASHG